ncbi:hypothetical protein COS31_00695 [Candidatus Roizmanbacteria bacterium CG02_land_8_20_14_3_00_36_15]|uniref:Uncharacterized protein n=1 Tax=Candidatus Roizmanbacteria bacterium CG10_big_fil_rev_8_21_14_0_10_36_26 TaxID=1974851 RepID=A0A2M8KMT2_9BACT|nr:MAG: hypothetical protein COS51_00540 [Candidatus Roizmanbacteria bacterium CG03_land_8_20_14_0_80_36_21]PIV38199.1 MAG: hypothetical protein COS31_00695 [Candidatus Roizmanbacteria bacterium CG02_land_8_20_14_3_00_36_15]PIY69995.1 MAG: hypothetical protein COY89_03475 [Candidatus Roizmanbacteria bacterium CG_4_10_14_0_8_um_filter_36_36]PJA52528.1 MAG: hypothetical protein CO166_05435 [Candidatus Roizmanbacteria bacterium CG_4_9_14_3_um_filter_36_11]PJE61219.1 MAG: hypothetical protein COU86
MKNNILITVIVALIVGLAGFYAGTKYEQSQRLNSLRQFGKGQFRNNGGASGQATGSRQGFRPVNGEIIVTDSNSITVKLQDSSSKIVLVSGQTSISKAEQATIADLKIGEKVAVFGPENSDGSVTASNIQLNPAPRNINGDAPRPQ